GSMTPKEKAQLIFRNYFKKRMLPCTDHLFVCGEEAIEYLDVTIRDTYTGELLQQEQISVKDSCIAVLKRDPVVWAWQTDVIGYDAEGNAYDLA
ncbi:MAG: hypothetical protein J6A71_08175, partial [Anaerotignum sp.]|nr:hypothetical protein [Anaerotignum sp.]